MPRHEELFCPRCGDSFECKLGSVLICECSSVELSEEQRSHIRNLYVGCLCAACLLELKTLWDADVIIPA